MPTSSIDVHRSNIFLQAYVFKSKNGACAAFLSNYHMNSAVKVKFNGRHYDLPAWSISILPDCKTAVFNTATVRGTLNRKSFCKLGRRSLWSNEQM